MDEAERIAELYHRIRAAASNWEPTTLSHYVGQPFKALVASMLSAQTREEQTLAAMNALFALASTPDAILALSDEQIRQAIRPVSYFESKARYLRDICERVVANGGVVPRTVDELTQYKGVGWKVAVLTLATGYGITDDITVDVHVARIGKRLRLVNPNTKQPPKINDELKMVLPRAMWPHWNALMVQFGRAVCLPTYPRCGTCLVRDLCPRVGVVETSPGSFRSTEYD
ncbi:MAG: endonuclease III [Anaerolineae bacterium]|nr:endonuclease III [Anaerolineae bacterium]